MAMTSEEAYKIIAKQTADRQAAAIKTAGLTADSSGNYQMKNDSTGGNGSFSASAVARAIEQGWGSASAPVDYNKLGANSVYRTENAAQVGNAPVPYANLTNTPTGYNAPSTMTQANGNSLAQAVGNQTPKAVDNSAMINSGYDSIATSLKAAIQQSINSKNEKIKGASAKYQPQKDNVEVGRGNELRSALEMSANSGDRGGIGRQQALDTNSNADKRLNDINLQQTDEETSLRNDISNLILEGDIQGAQNQGARLKDLVANSSSMDTINYNRGQDSFTNSLAQQAANNDQAITDSNLKDKATESMAKEVEVLVAANYNNISALRDQINTANPNDPRLPQIQAAINQKVSDQKAAQAAIDTKAAATKTAAQKVAYDNALDAWAKLGTTTPQMAAILGVPVGAKTASYNIQGMNAANNRVQTGISQQNANTNSRNASTSAGRAAWSRSSSNPDNAPKAKKSATYSYKNDAGFADDMQAAATGGTTAAGQLKSNASAFIQKYTLDGYKALLKASQGG